LAAT
jgi:hypothetical protein